MPDYSKGKIYIIRSYQTDKVYIGSTVQTLAQRLGKHRENYKRYKNGECYYLSSYEILKFEDHYIELIKDYPCKCKQRLNKKEGKYIRKYMKKNRCVNNRIAGRGRKQYYKDNKEVLNNIGKQYREVNKEKLNKISKQYREANKDKIKKYRSKQIVCLCGSTFRRDGKAEHERTKKHLKYINSLE